MPAYGPISRRDLIAAPRRLGFTGPRAGTRHEFMLRGQRKVSIPNPHSGDIRRELLSRVLKQAGVTREEWEKA